MMTVPQRRLARLALVACLAGAAVTGALAAGARAGSTLPGLNRNVVASWGSDGSGQLGDGNLRARSLYGRVNGIAGGIVQVAAGWVSALALTSDGTVLAWGSNGEGQLGNGTTSVAQPTPVQVIGLTGVTRIAEGTDFSLALRSDGTVWAWGGNDSGQLGDGTISNTSVPVQVPD
jgi:alpha-tubulin suppressor-like RCC1 family protein